MNDIAMREPIAVISWCPLDVKQLRPDWTDERCMEVLDSICRHLEDRSVEEGWNILESLLDEEAWD